MESLQKEIKAQLKPSSKPAATQHPALNADKAAGILHIEDLTQEKFSLQRALEASRTLAESLAAENSSLTDSYNQQRSIVNRLKSDMESLQEEIKAQLVSIYYI
ncbi:hypothetical protein GOBAR_DD20299 [Gossypium barbadense]|nr:hypothetical protein GOBAR_DD20299 [Gossypium barbadense]